MSQPVQLCESSTVEVVVALASLEMEVMVPYLSALVSFQSSLMASASSCWVWSCEDAPASNTLTPKSPQGTKPAIITTNVRAKRTSVTFWVPVRVEFSAVRTWELSLPPKVSSQAARSWSERMEEPLSRCTRRA